MKYLAVLLSLLVPAAASAQSAAQDWPAKPVRIIVPFAAGGTTDTTTRPFAEQLSQALGQQFVIENKGGAGGAIGTEAGVRSAPDGYTFFMATVAGVTIVPAARKTPWDPFKDMVPVAQYATAPLYIVVNPAVPAGSLQELVSYAKANPQKLLYGTAGLGSLSHMIGELFNRGAGIEMMHVPYRGGAEALTDLLGGHVQVTFEPIALPHVRAGKARLLAVVDPQRSPEFPDIPRLADVYPAIDVANWFGLFAPTGTPRPIVERMNAAMNDAARDPAVRDLLARASIRTDTSTPEELAARLRADYDRYSAVVRDINLTLE